MEPLLTGAQMREADRYTISGLGIPEMVLMEHAALGLVSCLQDRFGSLLAQSRGVVVAGTGNNGGDALAAARLLAERGCTNLIVILAGEEKRLSASAATQLQILGKLGVAHSFELSKELVHACDWIIDGIFGTGLSRPPESPSKEIIETINSVAGSRWILSADVPSGLDSDSGSPLGVAVRASETATFGFVKRGLVTGLAADYVGRLRLFPIQIPRLQPTVSAQAFWYTTADATRLPERRPAGHKGDYGKVYVIAGPPEKQGAAGLSALAALRGGAGLVTVIADPKDLEGLRPRLPPDVMTLAPAAELFQQEAVGVVGPGLGQSPAAWSLVGQALKSKWPLVLDADALNLIAEHRATIRRTPATVLTPHPKEAARLLESDVETVQKDRYASLEALVKKYECFVLLKGKGTLIGGPDLPPVVVTTGNTALSKGGTGDVLSGLVAAFLSQGTKPARAVPLAAYLHGLAAELVSQSQGQERSALASEVAGALPEAMRVVERAACTL